MRRQTTRAVVILCIFSTIMCAQSQSNEHNLLQETQTRGYWLDVGTGLTWAAKDNGVDVAWKSAGRYCRNLRLAGDADWRLPSIDELQGIYDDSGYAAPHPANTELALAGKPKGGLSLTGNHHWSSTKAKDDRGHSNGYAWYFDFSHGWKRWDPYGYHSSKRAICVRTASGPAPGDAKKK